MEQPLDFIYRHFKDVEEDDLEYVYRGHITPHLVMGILDLAKTNLAKAEDTRKMKSRIYYIMGEGLQNITMHQAETEPQQVDDDNSAIVVIYKKQNKYVIATGNLMYRSYEPALRAKLERINHLDAEGLKEMSREIRNTVEINEHGGASLGLIEMAKRSGNKLDYLIKPVDDTYSYFYLTTEIVTQKDVEESNKEEVFYTINDLVESQEYYCKNNYNLSFKGDFNQDNLLSLLSILKSGMDESLVRIKLYGVMVELLQNIVKHADSSGDGDKWKAGVFYIRETEGTFSLLAGNYIKKNMSKRITERIDEVNKMDNTELAKEYNRVLFNFNNDPISTGLGFIDIRRKAGTQIKYSIIDSENDKDFMMIQVDINK